MDFFTAEDRARRATILLVVLYLLAIVVVVLLTDAALSSIFAVYTFTNGRPQPFDATWTSLLPYIGVLLAAVILIATAMKSYELRGGGSVFGDMLGARWLGDRSSDPQEERLINVVEEMSVAQVKPPKICILDNEPGINAFAAGKNNSDAIIGVTKGCLTGLSRDELQAIVGHEFSHILHNDTALNTRAYAMIFGLLAISVIGAKTLSVLQYSGRGSSRGSGGMFVIILAGAVMMVVGWLGGLAGRIVRAAIVRQREFLADASSVQYTRNPDAVASALYKMATSGSHLNHSTGEEAEHFLFGAGSAGAWGRFGLTRTHPKTKDRIQAVRPGFQPSGTGAAPITKLTDDDEGYGTAVRATMEDFIDPTTGKIREQFRGALDGQGFLATAAMSLSDPSADIGVNPDSRTSSAAPINAISAIPPSVNSREPAVIERPQPTRSLRQPPSGLIAKLPSDLRSATIEPNFACALCFALAASDFPAEKWPLAVSNLRDTNEVGRVNVLLPKIRTVPVKQRMALLDLAVPLLQTMDADEQKVVFQDTYALLKISPQPDIIAIAVCWRLTRFLNQPSPNRPPVSSWAEGAAHIAVLLATVARLECGSGILAQNAYGAEAHKMSALGPLPNMPEAVETRPGNIQTALEVIASATPRVREAIVDAAANIILQEQIPDEGADLFLRIISDAAGQDVPDVFDRWI
jgi:Zn-dependent protease with chaperone function